MDKESFLVTMVYLDGAYGRSFPQTFRDVAWGMFQRLDGQVVGLAAVRMVEAGEEHPSPMKWRQHIEAIMSEAWAEQLRQRTVAEQEHRQRVLSGHDQPRSVARPRRRDETDEQRIAYLKELIGTADQDGTARAEDCKEYIRLVLARPYPPGHVLSTVKTP